MSIKLSILFKYILFLISTIILLSCDTKQNISLDETENKKLYIVATTSMVADAVKNVAGDCAVVEGLMGTGVDPHLYKITGSDAGKLGRADVIFYNGLHLEGKMTDILLKIAKTKPVHAITSDIPIEKLRKINPEGTIFDPHVWFDISLWQLTVQKIEQVLVKVDPKNAKYYSKNSVEYQKKLVQLHTQVTELMLTIPESQRILVTAHDAFGYFGLAYKIEVVGLQGVSTAAEYGIKDIERITDLLIQRKIPAIFVEDSVSSKSIEAVIQGANSRQHQIKLGGKLFSDSMGELNTPEGTYLGMFQHNVMTIVSALNQK